MSFALHFPRGGGRFGRCASSLCLALLVSLSVASRAEAANKFWIGTGNSVSDRWELNTNWSTVPRGPANTTAPSSGDVAVFNFSGGTVRIRSTATIQGLVMTNAWTGSVLQGTGVLNIGSAGFRVGSGTFVGGYGAGNGVINVSGTSGYAQTGGVVTRLQGNMSLSGSFAITSVNNSHPSYTNTGTLLFSGAANQYYTVGQNRVSAVIRNVTLQNAGSAGSNRINSSGSGMSLSGALTINTGILDMTRTSPAQVLNVKRGMTVASSTSAGFQTANNVILSGSLTVGSSASWLAGTGGTFTMSSDNPQTVTINGTGKRFKNITIANAGPTQAQRLVQLNSPSSVLNLSGALTISSGFVDFMTNSVAADVYNGMVISGANSVFKTNSDLHLSGSTALSVASASTVVDTGGTVTFASDNPQTVTLSNTSPRFNNLTINNGGNSFSRNSVRFVGNDFTLSGSLTVSAGFLDLDSNTIGLGVKGDTTVADSALAKLAVGGALTLSGNLIVKPNGTFTATGNTVTLNGGSQTLSGTITLYNFTRTLANSVSPAIISFYPGYTYTIKNFPTLVGTSSSQLLTLLSSISGSRSMVIWSNGKATFKYLRVKDSNSPYPVNCTDCTDAGNNLGWTFLTTPTTTSTSGGGSSGRTGGGGGGRGFVAPTTITPPPPVTPATAVTPPLKPGSAADLLAKAEARKQARLEAVAKLKAAVEARRQARLKKQAK